MAEDRLRSFLLTSIEFTVSRRCGDRSLSFEDSMLTEYDQEEIIYRIGSLISKISGTILLEISKTMRQIDLERRNYYGRDIQNQIQGRERNQVPSLGRRNERGADHGTVEPLRKEGSDSFQEPGPGKISGTSSERKSSSNAPEDGERSRRDARPSYGTDHRENAKGRTDQTGRHDGNDKSEDTGRYGSTQTGNRRDDPKTELEKGIQEQEKGPLTANVI